VTVFERANITHLSPNSLNLFASEPALWVLQYLLGRKFGVGCAAHRGSAAEVGVQAGLLEIGRPVEECQQLALASYDRLTALSADSRRAKEREAIPGIVAIALNELRQYGTLTAYQGRVVNRFEDVPVDILGYFDFEFAGAGVIVDLKTSLRLASEISTPHARQVAHYIAGGNREGRLCYATPAKLAVYRLENPAVHRAAMNNVARRLQRFLSISADPMELAGIVTPRVDEFWWSDPMARAAALEVYGL
jgi:hypothetical protein